VEFVLLETHNTMINKLALSARYTIAATVVGAVLSIVALVFVIAESGYDHASVLCAVLVYVAYWPLLLIGKNAHDLFLSFWVIPINVSVWAVIGFCASMVCGVIGRKG
jgi:hypothetical protein